MTKSTSSRQADHSELRGGILHCEAVPLPEIAARVGTPVYVYSTAAMQDNARALRKSLSRLGDPLIAYAVKANPNGAVLATLAREGLGADIVSGGEFVRARAAGIAADKIVFAGVGKTREEMRLALEAGICQFNSESAAEAEMLSEVAVAAGRAAPVGFRVNPDVEPGTHAKISTGAATSKFGIPIQDAPAEYAKAAALPALKIQGVAVHIGSQLTSLAPFEQAFSAVGTLIADLRAAGHDIRLPHPRGGPGGSPDPLLTPPPSPPENGAPFGGGAPDLEGRLGV